MHVVGLQTHMGMWVWVRQVWVQVVFEIPIRNPHPYDGFGGFFDPVGTGKSKFKLR